MPHNIYTKSSDLGLCFLLVQTQVHFAEAQDTQIVVACCTFAHTWAPKLAKGSNVCKYDCTSLALTAMIVVHRGAGDAEAFGATAVAAEVNHNQLKQMLTYPPDWGPTEWGPIPFLPQPDVLVSSMERQWGELAVYRGIATSATGKPIFSPLLPISCVSFK